MAESSFDVIPFEDIKGSWRKLGSGSFGNVYKGTYLGIDVAIKEVLPSTDYDVSKYFEREWRLMKECRHPNVVLYLGLSRAPDGRIFIISEYIENGNLRVWIHDKTKAFSWRLRLSFATDICRALAYLHARKCIHRDIKGENLLLTSNLRIKITDFGFARIAARNDTELKRLTFCGTDAYMSPEILNGTPFNLPTDVFSLGVILAEIGARHLADEKTFARRPPSFLIDHDELRKRIGGVKGCPPDYVQLVIDCLAEEPSQRPLVTDILERLRVMERELAINSDSDEEDVGGHVGSVKFVTNRGRRPGAAPRIPSFGMDVGKNIGYNAEKETQDVDNDDGDNSDEELAQAVLRLNSIDLVENVWGEGGNGGASTQPLIPSASSIAIAETTSSDYSTTVIRSAPFSSLSRSSVLTVRPASPTFPSDPQNTEGAAEPTDSMITIDSYHTASDSAISIAAATEGSMMTVRKGEENATTSRPLSTSYPPPPQRPVPPVPNSSPNGTPQRPSAAPLLHRFTIIKPGSISSPSFKSPTRSPARGNSPGRALGDSRIPAQLGMGWSPFHLFFASGLLVARCDLCGQRLGWKPIFECDDCGLRTHLKCGDNAPRDCGLRPVS